MPLTASEPKSFTPIAGKRILDWSLEAFRQNGLDRFVFIGGYLMDVVRRSYDAFEFVENANWPNGNILFSLLCARDHLGEGFYSTYTDTLFRPEAVGLLKDSPHDITLVMDTLWRDRYRYPQPAPRGGRREDDRPRWCCYPDIQADPVGTRHRRVYRGPQDERKRCVCVP